MNGTSNEATITITDDERPDAKIAFHASNASSTSKYTANVNETGGTINVPVTITDLPGSQTSFTVEVLSPTATATMPLATESATAMGSFSTNDDYRVLGNKTVTFGNTGSKTKNIQVSLHNNALVEFPETINLRIVAADSMSAGLNKHYARRRQRRAGHPHRRRRRCGGGQDRHRHERAVEDQVHAVGGGGRGQLQHSQSG